MNSSSAFAGELVLVGHETGQKPSVTRCHLIAVALYLGLTGLHGLVGDVFLRPCHTRERQQAG
jgi:hypothetical protein